MRPLTMRVARPRFFYIRIVHHLLLFLTRGLTVPACCFPRGRAGQRIRSLRGAPEELANIALEGFPISPHGLTRLHHRFFATAGGVHTGNNNGLARSLVSEYTFAGTVIATPHQYHLLGHQNLEEFAGLVQASASGIAREAA